MIYKIFQDFLPAVGLPGAVHLPVRHHLADPDRSRQCPEAPRRVRRPEALRGEPESAGERVRPAAPLVPPHGRGGDDGPKVC